jgi:hypothetical protein
MAVYKIFPEKDATLYSQYPSENTGLDEILELSTIVDNQVVYSSRPLIQFNQSEITDIINNKISGSGWQANLKLFLAYASNIPLNYTLYCYPISGSWNMGTGHYDDNPANETGVSWKYQLSSGSGNWGSSSFSAYATASFPTFQSGGATWYTGSSTLNPVSTQSFTYATSKDINLNVTNAVRLFSSGSISNNGFIIKKDDSIEFNSGSAFELRYFSVDTHTIYPPCLEFKWNDFTTVLTGSLTSSILTNSNFKLTLPNNPGYFYSGSIAKVRVNARPAYPTRTFSTSSIYTTNYFLPTSSYYAIKDLDTNEYVVDFDDTYTKISADSTSNYFIIYMNGLEPERYYKFLIKTIIDGQTIISDDSYYFKVING